MYRLSAYYLARFASDIPMDCLVPTLFCWIIYWMSGLRISAGEQQKQKQQPSGSNDKSEQLAPWPTQLLPFCC